MESKNIFVLLSELRSEYFVLLYVWWPFPLILGAKKVGKMSSYVSTEYDYVTVTLWSHVCMYIYVENITVNSWSLEMDRNVTCFLAAKKQL